MVITDLVLVFKDCGAEWACFWYILIMSRVNHQDYKFLQVSKDYKSNTFTVLHRFSCRQHIAHSCARCIYDDKRMERTIMLANQCYENSFRQQLQGSGLWVWFRYDLVCYMRAEKAEGQCLSPPSYDRARAVKKRPWISRSFSLTLYL